MGPAQRLIDEIRQAIEDELSRLRLTLHPAKTRLCARRVSWVEALPPPTPQQDLAEGLIDWSRVEQSVQAWIGHAAFGDTYGLRQQRLGQLGFVQGMRPSRAGGVVQQ